MKKVFISGKITGENIRECMDKFFDVRSSFWLDNIDYLDEESIIIPQLLDGIYFGISHKEAMEICLKELKTCTHIYMLKDWKESKGAKIEHEFAKENGIKIIYQ